MKLIYVTYKNESSLDSIFYDELEEAIGDISTILNDIFEAGDGTTRIEIRIVEVDDEELKKIKEEEYE